MAIMVSTFPVVTTGKGWPDYITQVSDPSNLGQIVYFDSLNGVAGTGYPVGTSNPAVNNDADLRAICIARNIRRVFIIGTLMLTANMEGYDFQGANTTRSIVNLNGRSVAGSTFSDLYLTGAGTGDIFANRCHVIATGLGEVHYTDSLVSAIALGGKTYLYRGFVDGNIDANAYPMTCYDCVFGSTVPVEISNTAP